MSSTLIENLQKAKCYSHSIGKFQLLQTHISWVILTGEYAYKIKKPLDLKFLDYSTLARRKHFCEEELRINQKLAPDLYLKVVPIYGSETEPTFEPADDDSEIIEYALVMHQFEQSHMFDQLLANNQLSDERMLEVTELLAAFHANTERAAAQSAYGTPEQIWQPVEQNFTQSLPLVSNVTLIAQLRELFAWSEQAHQSLHESFVRRKSDDRIRKCHGDVHLGNMVDYKGKALLFDAIEFNPDLQYTDTMADLGFLVMDLIDKQQTAFANLVINQYCLLTDNYDGLQVLKYYIVYRAMVRAKINLMRLHQSDISEQESTAVQANAQSFVSLAQRVAEPIPASLTITYGVTGSGKSTLATQHCAQTGAIVIRSDVTRKRLAGIDIFEQTNADVGEGIYSEAMTEKTFDKLATHCEQIITAGFSVIVDACFLKRSERERFETLAATLNVPFHIVKGETDVALIEANIAKRAQQNRRISEGNLDVMQAQLQAIEVLTPSEEAYIVNDTVHIA